MTERKQRILVVEDEEALLMGLKENLEVAGYDVSTATDGPAALKLGRDTSPDLIVLDIMLPGMSGYDVCRKLRDQGVQAPVLMLTARQDEFDKLHGFEMGADDYVTKPFSVAELLARIKALLMRGARRDVGPREYAFDDFVLDMEERVLRKKAGASEPQRSARQSLRGRKSEGRAQRAEKKSKEGHSNGHSPLDKEWENVTLTRTEFDLLAYFCANEGKALSRDKVMNDVWGTEYFGTQRSLDSFVASLRAKIEKMPSAPKHILTVHGVGYKFVK